MKITALMVKKLRDRTGVGIMDCKKVLVECDGDEDKAVEVLRKKGAAMADSRSGRQASEGLIVSRLSADQDFGALIEVNCETDFVARGDAFQAFAAKIGEVALSLGEDCDDAGALKQMQYEDGQTVEESRLEILSKIRENISIRRIAAFKAPAGSVVGSYVHRGKMGILTEVTGEQNGDVANDLAIHVAVKKPLWLDASAIPEEVLAKEREIYTVQAKESGKPEFIIDRIVTGKLQKFCNESTLLGQSYYEDDTKTVKSVLKEKNVSLNRFRLFQLGEKL